MLETFTIETFEGRENETFEVQAGDQQYALALTSVTPSGAQAEGRRRAFSLLFVGPGDIILPQATYELSHAVLGTFDLFIVPVGKNAQGVQYEAVFT
jgi:hypothetical protein